jgi:hypothetical protein
MSKHETFATLDAPVLSPIAFLKANGLYIQHWRVLQHKVSVTLRYGWQETDIVNLAFIAIVAMLISVPVASSAMIVSLVLWPDSAVLGTWCGVFAATTASLVAIASYFFPRVFLPRWHTRNVTFYDRFNRGREVLDLPEQVKNIRDLIAFAFPGSSFEVEAFGDDPIMWALIPGQRRSRAVCFWDYKDRKAVMLHPL